jgi:hypothetical protein
MKLLWLYRISVGLLLLLLACTTYLGVQAQREACKYRDALDRVAPHDANITARDNETGAIIRCVLSQPLTRPYGFPKGIKNWWSQDGGFMHMEWFGPDAFDIEVNSPGYERRTISLGRDNHVDLVVKLMRECQPPPGGITNTPPNTNSVSHSAL